MTVTSMAALSLAGKLLYGNQQSHRCSSCTCVHSRQEEATHTGLTAAHAHTLNPMEVRGILVYCGVSPHGGKVWGSFPEIQPLKW